MKKLVQAFSTLLPALALTCLPLAIKAADHADSPAMSQDQGADIADVYTFLDPNDNNQVIIIGTVHGFIVPGEAGNFGAFDPNVRYRFEIYNKHVQSSISAPTDPGASASASAKAQYAAARTAYLNTITPARTIDLAFSRRIVPADTTDAKINLARPVPQIASITLTGFPGAPNKGVFVRNDANEYLSVTGTTAGPTPLPQKLHSLNYTGPGSTTKMKFFAGESDDPFFFDLVGFSRLITSVHNGAADPSTLSRARDSFAGYNVMSIALSIPKSLLVDASGPVLGVDFITQRHAMQLTGVDGFTGTGAFKNVDRMGNPAVNVALVPFNKKNIFNAYFPKADAAGFFAGDIVATIGQLGFNTPPAKIAVLASLAVSKGDLLFLNTSISNTGSGGGTVTNAGYPNGRRLQDDVIDTILTILAGDALGGPVGDGVNGNDQTFQDNFPFLALPQQPQAKGSLEDNTRN